MTPEGATSVVDATTPTAFVTQTDATSRHATVAALRDLGFAVTEFEDPTHLYAHTLRAAATPHGDLGSLIIFAEPTSEMVAELEVLRSGHWTTPFVLVGKRASRELARRLRAAWLPCEQPTREGLRRAIAMASDLGVPDAAVQGAGRAKPRLPNLSRRNAAA